jgi:hypothetical protein
MFLCWTHPDCTDQGVPAGAEHISTLLSRDLVEIVLRFKAAMS